MGLGTRNAPGSLVDVVSFGGRFRWMSAQDMWQEGGDGRT